VKKPGLKPREARRVVAEEPRFHGGIGDVLTAKRLMSAGHAAAAEGIEYRASRHR